MALLISQRDTTSHRSGEVVVSLRQLAPVAVISSLVICVACTSQPPVPTAPPAKPAESAAKAAEKAAAQPATKRPSSLAELAAYSGPDRQQILEEGARQEGKLMWYTSIDAENHRPMVEAFRQKYPFIDVEVIRLDSNLVVTRVQEEFRAGRYLVDNLGGSYPGMVGLRSLGALQPYTSPEASGIPAELHAKDRTAYADREQPLGVTTNTELIPDSAAPRSYDDLLNPALKGKLTISDSSQAQVFVGALVLLKGEDFVRKLGEQNLTVYPQTGTAIVSLIAAGETPSTIGVTPWITLRPAAKGAPLRWWPLDPVPTNMGYAAISNRAPHPHAAMLMADFLLSEVGQQQYAKNLSGPTRTSVRSAAGHIGDFKRFNMDTAVPDEQYEKAYTSWGDLIRNVLARRGGP